VLLGEGGIRDAIRAARVVEWRPLSGSSSTRERQVVHVGLDQDDPSRRERPASSDHGEEKAATIPSRCFRRTRRETKKD
jgi:hypothetical protein